MGQGGNFGQGNRGEDVITAGEGIDTLLGGQDNDTVSGGGGNDFLNGNRGDDLINGGDGADTLYGEGGSDTLTGGLGADVFHGFADGGLDRITDFSRAEGDRIVLDAGTAYTSSQVGSDVVVAYGANQIVIVGVNLASLTGDWITT
jgi:Ca2+-binding RTX toxin-like protein